MERRTAVASASALVEATAQHLCAVQPLFTGDTGDGASAMAGCGAGALATHFQKFLKALETLAREEGEPADDQLWPLLRCAAKAEAFAQRVLGELPAAREFCRRSLSTARHACLEGIQQCLGLWLLWDRSVVCMHDTRPFTLFQMFCAESQLPPLPRAQAGSCGSTRG